MDKSTKLLLLTCFILVGALGLSMGFLFQDISDKNSKSHISNQSNTTIEKNVSKSVCSPQSGDQTSYAGESYKLYDADDFAYVGEAVIICPKCGGRALQVGNSVRNDYYYYFFKCSDCGGRLAGYATVE